MFDKNNVGGGTDPNHDPAANVTSEAGLPESSAFPANAEDFVPIGELRRSFGITRATAYLLAAQGLISTVSTGQGRRGRRFVSVPSVRAYLAALANAEPANHSSRSPRPKTPKTFTSRPPHALSLYNAT